jgi:hypothetical protein
MRVEYNHLGEECELIKASQREEMCMGWGQQFYNGVFVHEEQIEIK